MTFLSAYLFHVHFFQHLLIKTTNKQTNKQTSKRSSLAHVDDSSSSAYSRDVRGLLHYYRHHHHSKITKKNQQKLCSHTIITYRRKCQQTSSWDSSSYPQYLHRPMIAVGCPDVGTVLVVDLAAAPYWERHCSLYSTEKLEKRKTMWCKGEGTLVTRRTTSDKG